MTAELIEHLFLPAYGNDTLRAKADAATIELPGTRIAVTTDSFVVRPLFFPGGSIGDLAVHGTINDLVVSGARPLVLTAAFILEEGCPLETLARIAQDMQLAAVKANVSIVAGDTKVVERGHGDGCYITTTGLGTIPLGRELGVDRARPGDCVLVSGTLGDHGMAVMSVREGLEFEAPIRSDTASLHELAERMWSVCPVIRAMRDPTRGGLAVCLNDLAEASHCGIEIDERRLPIDPVVQSACEFLGLDPLLVANEGKLVAVVPREHADGVLSAMRGHPLGAKAELIGEIVDDDRGQVVLRTRLGTRRIISVPMGEQLPRIC